MRRRGEEGEGRRDAVGQVHLAERFVAPLVALDGAGDGLAVLVGERDAGDPFGLLDQLGRDLAGLLRLQGQSALKGGGAEAEAGQSRENAAASNRLPGWRGDCRNRSRPNSSFMCRPVKKLLIARLMPHGAAAFSVAEAAELVLKLRDKFVQSAVHGLGDVVAVGGGRDGLQSGDVGLGRAFFVLARRSFCCFRRRGEFRRE